MSKQSFFNNEWRDKTLHPGWFWLKEVETNPFQGMCTLCKKKFDLSNMGVQAVKSHERSKKHCNNISAYDKQLPMSSFFKKNNNIKSTNNVLSVVSPEGASFGATEPCSSTVEAVSNPPMSSKSQKAITNFCIRDEVTKAEILWALRVTYNNESYRSCTDVAQTFLEMFPDSEIAKQFKLGKTKVAYNIVHGIAPYFHEILFQKIVKCDYVTIMFDEALNEVVQQCQMDVCIRFWDVEAHKVSTRYFSSSFLGHTTAEDLRSSFNKTVGDQILPKLVQVSMDGPSVNWKFFEALREAHSATFDIELIDIGSCGLHVIHGAFQSGHKAAGWKVNQTLRSFYRLFKDSPARRADYLSLCGTSKFPLKFCSTRWVENAIVAERALEVFDNVKSFVETSKLPKTITAQNVQDAFKDPLIKARIHFFLSIANVVEPFLKQFQSPSPLVPFLYDELHHLLSNLMERVIKKETFRNAHSLRKLWKIDVQIEKCHWKEVVIGVGAASVLEKSKVSSGEKIKFREECISFLLSVILKLKERSPLKYKFTRALSSLAPDVIIKSPDLAKKRMGELVILLHECGLIKPILADRATVQFSRVCNLATTTTNRDDFQKFSISKNRLDEFYYTLIGTDEEYIELFQVVKIAMILSHGNAQVESGFSVNSNLLVENLSAESVVAQRQVYDAVHNIGIHKVEVTKKMLKSVRSSHERYMQALAEKKEQKSEEENQTLKKRHAQKQIKELKAKKARMEKDTVRETDSINAEISRLTSSIYEH